MPRICALASAAALLFGGALASAAEKAGRDQAWLAQMQAQQQVLAELESSRDSFDPALLEPLQAMIDLLEQRSEFERVAELQERQLGLMRAGFGLESPRLIPLLRQMVTTGVALGDAEAVTGHLQLLRHLQGVAGEPDELLQALDTLAHWHLTGGAGEDGRERAKNFFAARKLVEKLEKAAIELHGEGSPALAPWLYRSALSDYQLVAVLNSRQGLVSPMIRELVWHDGAMRLQGSVRGFSRSRLRTGTVTPVVEPGELVGEAYLREAVGKIDDIAELFDAAGDPEAQAMAMIYRADFQLLMGRGTAFSRYREAQQKLREAGVAESRIEWFFGRPQLLPANSFHASLGQAIAELEAELAPWRPEREEAAAPVALYAAWDESAPNMRAPVSEHVFWEVAPNLHQIDLELDIDRRGGVSSVAVIAAVPDDHRSRRLAKQAVRELRFRPAMEAGRGLRVRDAQMRVLLPRRDD